MSHYYLKNAHLSLAFLLTFSSLFTMGAKSALAMEDENEKKQEGYPIADWNDLSAGLEMQDLEGIFGGMQITSPLEADPFSTNLPSEKNSSPKKMKQRKQKVDKETKITLTEENDLNKKSINEILKDLGEKKKTNNTKKKKGKKRNK